MTSILRPSVVTMSVGSHRRCCHTYCMSFSTGAVYQCVLKGVRGVPSQSLSSIMRARYLPMMSNSMFTFVPCSMVRKLVCSKV